MCWKVRQSGPEAVSTAPSNRYKTQHVSTSLNGGDSGPLVVNVCSACRLRRSSLVQRHYVLHIYKHVNALGVAVAARHMTCFECCRPHGLQVEAQQFGAEALRVTPLFPCPCNGSCCCRVLC
jgi:hypothetical protein